MSHLTRLNQLINPVALALRLLPARGRLLMLALAAVISVALISIFAASLETLEERLGAQGWLLSADDTPEERITIVAIDEASLAEIGAWPWSRSDMARLVSGLNDAGVQLQLHDITYPEARDGDDELIAALSASRGAVLAQVPVLATNGQQEQNVRTGVMTFPLAGLDCSSSATANSTNSFIAPHAGFSAIPKGHIAPIVASDGGIRKVPAFVCVDGQAYPAMAISALLQAINAPNWSVTLSEGTGLFAPEQVLRLDAYPGLAIPLDEDGNLRVSYRDLPQNFRAVSAADVINGRIDPGMLEGGVAIIGATAFGIGDIVPTPYSGATPGVELKARLLGSLLDTTMPYTPRGADWMLGLLALMFAGITLLLASARERIAAYGLPIAAVLMPVITLGIHWQLLAVYEIWLGWLFPAMFGLLAASLLLLLEQSRVRDERSRVWQPEQLSAQ